MCNYTIYETPKHMTWEEMQRQFPDSWVFLTDLVMLGRKVGEGTVLATSTDQDVEAVYTVLVGKYPDVEVDRTSYDRLSCIFDQPELLTWEEACVKYPDQYVYMTQPVLDGEIIRGYVSAVCSLHQTAALDGYFSDKGELVYSNYTTDDGGIFVW